MSGDLERSGRGLVPWILAGVVIGFFVGLAIVIQHAISQMFTW